MRDVYKRQPYAAFVGSFKRFKELGYNIKAGEHGMGIMAYTPIIFYRPVSYTHLRIIVLVNKKIRTVSLRIKINE